MASPSTPTVGPLLGSTVASTLGSVAASVKLPVKVIASPRSTSVSVAGVSARESGRVLRQVSRDTGPLSPQPGLGASPAAYRTASPRPVASSLAAHGARPRQGGHVVSSCGALGTPISAAPLPGRMGSLGYCNYPLSVSPSWTPRAEPSARGPSDAPGIDQGEFRAALGALELRICRLEARHGGAREPKPPSAACGAGLVAGTMPVRVPVEESAEDSAKSPGTTSPECDHPLAVPDRDRALDVLHRLEEVEAEVSKAIKEQQSTLKELIKVTDLRFGDLRKETRQNREAMDLRLDHLRNELDMRDVMLRCAEELATIGAALDGSDTRLCALEQATEGLRREVRQGPQGSLPPTLRTSCLGDAAADALETSHGGTSAASQPRIGDAKQDAPPGSRDLRRVRFPSP